MQFASGEPPTLVYERDLRPEVTYFQAHEMIARDVADYILGLALAEADSFTRLSQRLTDTYALVSPILDSLFYEGYHNFLPPCLCTTDVCEPADNCTAGCPFTKEVSQDLMGAGLNGVVINNIDSFHDVWETEPEVHLPAVSFILFV